jgi:hypothetical protein
MLLDCDPDSSVRVTLTNVLNARTSEQERFGYGRMHPISPPAHFARSIYGCALESG